MNYSADDRMVRVDFWKASGKWYTTEAILWTGAWGKDVLIHKAFARSLCDALGDRLSDMRATCLEPYHKHSHPISLINWKKFLEEK